MRWRQRARFAAEDFGLLCLYGLARVVEELATLALGFAVLAMFSFAVAGVFVLVWWLDW